MTKKFVKLVHLVGFIVKKFVTMQHGHVNVKKNLVPMSGPEGSAISGFRREGYDNCALLGHYASSSGSLLPTFRDNLAVPSSGVKNPEENPFLYLEDGNDGLSRNVSKTFPPLYANNSEGSRS